MSGETLQLSGPLSRREVSGGERQPLASPTMDESRQLVAQGTLRDSLTVWFGGRDQTAEVDGDLGQRSSRGCWTYRAKVDRFDLDRIPEWSRE
jgi:hypothetical protein